MNDLSKAVHKVLPEQLFDTLYKVEKVEKLNA